MREGVSPYVWGKMGCGWIDASRRMHERGCERLYKMVSQRDADSGNFAMT